MRGPSEYLAAAFRGLRSCALRGCAVAMTHGDEVSTVVRTTATGRGGDDLEGDAPAEEGRYLAAAADYPTLAKGDTVTLGETVRLVTSATTDIAQATKRVGVSKPLGRYDATVTGVRGDRRLSFSTTLLALRNGLETDVGDGYAPTEVYGWTLIVSGDEWPEVEPPQIGDEFRFVRGGGGVTVRASRMERRDGYFKIAARGR